MSAAAAPSAEELLAQRFTERVEPFLQAYCRQCHGQEKPKGKLDLTAFRTLADVARGHGTWQLVLDRLKEREMPPEDAPRRPSATERQVVIDWITAVRADVAQRNAGDPGVVPIRRLSSVEFNNTIRDLTGVDLRPARDFPVDPANEAGFDNSAESLAMSPALLQKYVDAARFVADHLVLKPAGFAFAPHPVVTDTDRDKYCVKRIVEFYYRQPTDLADYFAAAWRFQHRERLGLSGQTLERIAADSKVSPKYLTLVWTALTGSQYDVGPMARLQAMWRELAVPDGPMNAPPVASCEAMRDFVLQLRKKLEPRPSDLDVRGIHKGSQPFVLWKNGQYAAARRLFRREALQIEGETFGAADSDLLVPANSEARERYEASFARFCDVFPDAFYIAERGRDYVGKAKEAQEKGRLLSAGFHSMMGYYRDDQPLCDLILNDRQRGELEALWQELDFVASAPQRQYTGFLWFERTDSRYMRDPEFDFARSEDKDVTSEAKIKALAAVYLAKAKANGADDVPAQAIQDYFANINRQIRWVEHARLAAEPGHVTALLHFAARAFRRPLTGTEREELVAFYHSQRMGGQLTHEEAIQDALVSILVSPRFCYRMDLVSSGAEMRRLTDHELASRLSYFLWSSMPDEELLTRAASGDLHQPAVLLSQTRRMLQDERIRGLATEFAANWLDFRRFEEHNSVARERFPSFTNELRQAMFEEPIHFFVDLVQRDGSILDFLYAKHTFVNPVLAEHYEIPDLDLGLDRESWVRVEDATSVGRGSLLPMAVFLTQNAPGLRTSPVKRGYWVVRRLLGERIPPPPPDVPELPGDETKLELSLRETLAKHREHASCAGCHQRFDSLGVVFEGYGPVGERRTVDLAGRPVEISAEFPGGGAGSGLAGLQAYLREHRQQEFVDNLCRKLLSFALGRSLIPSDDSLVTSLRQELAANDHRFGVLIESIVMRPQFLTKRPK